MATSSYTPDITIYRAVTSPSPGPLTTAPPRFSPSWMQRTAVFTGLMWRMKRAGRQAENQLEQPDQPQQQQQEEEEEEEEEGDEFLRRWFEPEAAEMMSYWRRKRRLRRG
ncbi:hypothetical protein N0V85_005829 [Neurospora sp. IMI 360204]|nr:hypothetical protein N0V85_005829 [Neurospora sp. IMI 360204]